MSVRSSSNPWASSVAARLREDFRCRMCHKHCAVPCRFSAAEFLRLEEWATGEGSDGREASRS